VEHLKKFRVVGDKHHPPPDKMLLQNKHIRLQVSWLNLSLYNDAASSLINVCIGYGDDYEWLSVPNFTRSNFKIL